MKSKRIRSGLSGVGLGWALSVTPSFAAAPPPAASPPAPPTASPTVSPPVPHAAPTAAAAPASAPAPALRVSEEADRRAVNLTVYNSDFGLVREVRQLAALPSGQVALEYRDVAATIQPETVVIHSLAKTGGLRVLEQNYRYDLLTPETLLDKYVGRNVRAYRYHEATGREDVAEAKLLSVANGPILQIGSEITFNYPGRLAFSELPPNLIAKPTLVWLLENSAPESTIEVSYLARSLSWSADYVLVLDASEKLASLVGWVTLVNDSGASYRHAALQLVAGDVNRVQPPQMKRMNMAMDLPAPSAAPAFQEQGLLEYHLYTLQRPTDVLDKEQKQVTLLEAAQVGVTKQLVFFGQEAWYQSQYGELSHNQKVSVYLELQNSAQNHLGIPLPKGTLRVYKADQAGAKQFVGEDAIDHTPRDEKLHVKLGEAFDVVGDRKQQSWSALGDCSSESAWEIELRNHEDEEVNVAVREPAGGDWTIVSSSQPALRDDAHAFHFDVKVPKRGSTKVTYRVRVRWC